MSKINRKKLTKVGQEAAQEILTEFLAKGNKIPNEPRFPVSSDLEVATLYASPPGPNEFKVPGVDSVSSRVQLYINEATAFTGAYSCIDPETGTTRKGKNGHPDCVKDWLNVYLISYKHIVEQYKKLTTKEQKQAFLDAKRPELVTLALHLDRLSANPELSKADKQKITKAQSGITKLMTIYANAGLAQRIAANQEQTLQQAYDYYLEELRNPTLSSRDLKILEDTLLDLTSRTTKWAAQRTDILNLQQQRTIQEQEAINQISNTIIAYIEQIGNVDYSKKQEAVDFTLKQLKSPSKEVSVQVKSWNQNYSNLLSTILYVKSNFSLTDQREIYKKVESNYSIKNTLKKPTSFFSNQINASKLQSYFPELRRAAKDFANQEFKPVCNTINPEQLKKFASFYAYYHELMMAVMIFYFTACSDAYKDADITDLAQDWLNWLQGNPFLMKLPANGNVRKMRAEEFLPFAPQNIFSNVLIPSPDWNAISDTGLTQDNFGKITLSNYTNEYQELLNLAAAIQSACDTYVSSGQKITEYSERFKFLSQVVLNFDAVWNAIQANRGGIRWEIVDGKVKRFVDRNVISSCVSNLEGIAKQLNGTTATAPTSTPIPTPPPATSSAPAVTAPPEVELPPNFSVILATLNQTDAETINARKEQVRGLRDQNAELAANGQPEKPIPNLTYLDKWLIEKDSDGNVVRAFTGPINVDSGSTPLELTVNGYNVFKNADDVPLNLYLPATNAPIVTDDISSMTMDEVQDSTIYGQPWTKLWTDVSGFKDAYDPATNFLVLKAS